ncbi:ATP-binding protein [Actinoallomurus rhizosphaericola]|uniref:ATP-binding protein n=1 Tax=Actinoallomurus rhizosphaericola TaxID=2952536 RepID=UPI002090308E|nr:ATP-binding protein [Actinoallomurus rhizosphaericola]MCO5993238.1 ATP-binding protein [Actinoallomurus rhizosphaericola]
MMTFDIPQPAGNPQIGRHAAPAADPLGVLASAPAVVRPSWIALGVSRTSVAKARRFAAEVIRDHVTDPDHADSIVLVVSELVTNARRAATEVRRWEPHDLPLRFGLLATDRYVHLYVTDPDPRPFQPNPAPTNGWGLGIVDTYAAARWVTYTDTDKTVHVLITAPGVTLLPGEVDVPETGPPSSA